MNDWKSRALELHKKGKSWRSIARKLGKSKSTVSDYLRKQTKGYIRPQELKEESAPESSIVRNTKVLFLDIETKPLIKGGWGMFNQNYSLEQIEEDWAIISFSCKWMDCEDAEYYDITQNTEVDLLYLLHDRLSQADFVVGHNCVEVSTPVLTQDLKWVPVGELKVGDKIVGFDEGKDPYNPCRDSKGGWIKEEKFSGRHVKGATVTEHSIEEKDCVQVNLSNGDKIITTRDHYWLGRAEKDKNLRWYKSEDLRKGQRFYKYAQVWEEDKSYEAGWLSGFISGEGTLKKSGTGSVSGIEICQRPGETWDQALDYFKEVGIPLGAKRKPKTGGLGRGDTLYAGTVGGKWKAIEHIGRLQIKRFIDRIDWDSFGGLKGQGLEEVTVVSVEDVGKRKVAIMGTSSSTFIAGGYAMHNCKRFDLKKIRARMIINGFPPYNKPREIDTLEIAKREFGFTSNKLAYLTQTLCKKYVKSSHEKFHGYLLWKEFLKGNPEAIQEMREYNILDVLSLQELFEVLAPWDSKLPNFDLYTEEVLDNKEWEEDGYHYTNLGKYKKYRNVLTGQYRRGRVNLLSKEKRASLLANIV